MPTFSSSSAACQLPLYMYILIRCRVNDVYVDGRLPTPEPPGDYVYEELLTRTSWCNAEYAYREIERGRAQGNKAALWLRARLQALLFYLGCTIQLHCGKTLFLGIIIMGAFAVGLKQARIETNVEKLWVEVGGRLEQELDYTTKTLGEGWGTTNQIIIQTPKENGGNVLTQEALLQHVRSSLLATQVQVEMYGQTWSFKDVCHITEFPAFEDNIVDQIISQLIPCTIITPLDCFWEGSRLLGPENPVHIPFYNDTLRWKTLDPIDLLDHFADYEAFIAPESLRDIFNRTGIGHAYQTRPCLNPKDPECPNTAPNKKSGQVPDIAAELTGGCTGFASAFMVWPEELIVGGVTKNASNQIKSAEALQSIIQLKGQKMMYEAWKGNYKVDEIRWTAEKAGAIVEEWQRKFTQEVRNSSVLNSQDVNAFTSASLDDLLQEFSELSVVRVAMGYVFMVIYAFFTMMKLGDSVRSQGGVGLSGVLLVAFSVVASLGFCAWIGLTFNASTTQVLPFLALGVGVDDMFLLAHSSTSVPSEVPLVYKTGEILRRSGVSVLLTSLNNMCAFLLAAVIPIPALRSLSLQFAIVIVFNFLAIVLVFPAILALDIKRRDAKRVDIFCCLTSNSPSANRVIRVQPRPAVTRPPLPRQTEVRLQSTVQAVTQTTRTTGAAGQGERPYVTVVHSSPVAATTEGITPVVETPPSTAPSTASTRTLIRQDSLERERPSLRERCRKAACWRWSLSGFARGYYAPFLQKLQVKVGVLVFFACLLGLSIYGVTQIEDGLEITDIVPRGTREEAFLEAQMKYFSFYNMYGVTQEDFDYAHRQRLLHAYHSEFRNIEQVIREPDGSLPSFWLITFRDWLLEMQREFDRDKKGNAIIRNNWYNNASEKGVLAYKMLIQTGIPERPIDFNRFLTERLVDDHGVINPDGFYNYLTVWCNYDTWSYSASQAMLHPAPAQWTPGGKTDRDVTIPRSSTLNYTQLPFYLNNLRKTQDFISVVRNVRNLSEYFVEQGLPNYPMGVPFTFWEQYLDLRFYLALSLLSVLGASFLVLAILLANPWAALILVCILGMITTELFGFMGLLGIKLSAIPAVTLIISVGLGVEFTLHTCYAYLTTIGDRNQRVTVALEHTFSPVVDGAVSTLLGVVMLAGSEFDFIVSYFFYVFTALVVIGALNGLVLLPVILSLVGPPAEVRPPNNATRLTTPTPPPTPPIERSGMAMQGQQHRPSRRRGWEGTEFGGSVSSMGDSATYRGYGGEQIEVHPPEVVVQTFAREPQRQEWKPQRPHHQWPRSPRIHHPNMPHYTSSSSSSPSPSPQMPHHVTTVTATAKVSILHPVCGGGVGCGDRTDSYKYHKRRRDWEKGGGTNKMREIQDKGERDDGSSDSQV
ncbi:protein patched homolog 1-like isoform X2 [Acanthaster planci]|uniref:Protein patched homolog 1-like isoform X2 n=1 Tax=Acanthaster planci TaxID=133434 RepID=A0A8B7ZKP1_ACAPL|nr:protein patched homolog 1-like isoform X2 [Acanthaster planci]